MAENVPTKKSAVEQVLECQLCSKQIHNPHTLQECLHSFCKACIDNLAKQVKGGLQGWVCPKCDKFTKADEVKHNDFINDLIKLESEETSQDPEKVLCVQCDSEVQATGKCMDCKIELCSGCHKGHLRIPMLKGHTIQPLEFETEKYIDRLVFCEEHIDIPDQLNCKPCEKAMCFKCKIKQHEGHETETVDEAIERIIPQLEFNSEQIEGNIKMIELQIDGINNKIEQTRESYAVCRISMDDHLEKIICRLRAMKAEMEDQVSEQETVALDTLSEIRQKLEHRLSEAWNLVNLVATYKAKARNISLLNEVQGNLFNKVIALGCLQVDDICTAIPEGKFQESNTLQSYLTKVFGDVQFVMENNYIDISGELSVDRYMCENFKEYFETPMEKDLQIEIETQWCNHMSYIDNKIWLPLKENKTIHIYNMNGDLDKVLSTGDHKIRVVDRAHNGDVIIGGDSGLYITETECSEFTLLKDGFFCDIVVHGNQISAFKAHDCCILTFKLINNQEGKAWTQISLMSLSSLHTKNNSNFTVSYLQDCQFLVSSAIDQKAFLVTKTEEKVVLENTPFMFTGLDRQGSVLGLNFRSGGIYSFNCKDTDITKKELLLSKHLMNMVFLRDMVIDRDNNLWCLIGNQKKYTIKKIITL